MLSLNSRELASLFWLTAVVLWSAWRGPSLRESLTHLVKRVLQPTIVAVFALMSLYMGVVVWGLYEIGLWKPQLLKATLLWFLFSGVGIAVNAVSRLAINGRALLRDSIKVVVLVEFFVGTYVYSIGVEFILVPVVGFIAAMGAYIDATDREDLTAKLVKGLQAFVGLIIIGAAFARTLNDYGALLSLESLRELLLAPALALLFVPCVWVLVFYAVCELLVTRIGMSSRPKQGVKKYALRTVIRTCGLSIKNLRALLQEHPGRLMRVSTHQDVDRLVEALC